MHNLLEDDDDDTMDGLDGGRKMQNLENDDQNMDQHEPIIDGGRRCKKTTTKIWTNTSLLSMGEEDAKRRRPKYGQTRAYYRWGKKDARDSE